jgi:hypothetical protein
MKRRNSLTKRQMDKFRADLGHFMVSMVNMAALLNSGYELALDDPQKAFKAKSSIEKCRARLKPHLAFLAHQLELLFGVEIPYRFLSVSTRAEFAKLLAQYEDVQREDVRDVAINICEQLQSDLAPVLAHHFLNDPDFSDMSAVCKFSELLKEIAKRAYAAGQRMREIERQHADDSDKVPMILMQFMYVTLLNGFVAVEALGKLLPDKCANHELSLDVPLQGKTDLKVWIIECVKCASETVARVKAYIQEVDFTEHDWPEHFPR